MMTAASASDPTRRVWARLACAGSRRALPSLAVAFALAPLSCDRGPGVQECYGVCGEGTQCVAGKCVVAQADEPEPEPEPTKKGRRGRKGKRKRGGAGDASAPFKPVDDSHIPRYDPNAVQTIGPGSGTERLADRTIRQHLSRLEPKFNKCIETAAMHSEDELGAGRIDFVFAIKPSGRISGVNVSAPKHLRVFGIVPCLRKVLWDHHFPSYDGPQTGVDYSFRVE